MKPESIEKLLGAFDYLAEQLGASSLNEAIAKASKVAAITKLFISAIEKAESREQLAALLAVSGEPQPEQLELLIALITSMPTLIKRAIPKVETVANDTLPAAPKGRHKISSTLQRQVCDYVLELFGKGVTLTICKKRAAARFGIGYRSVERCWEVRGQITPDLDTAKTFAAGLLARKFKDVLEEPHGRKTDVSKNAKSS